MLRVNKKIEYGVLALLHLSSEPEKTACVREIASHCKIPETLLSKIMQSMKTAGYVKAVQGNQGGYRLAKGLGEITLLDVTQLLSGPVQMTECLEAGNHDCPVKEGCAIKSPMQALNEKIIHLFKATSLETLARKAV